VRTAFIALLVLSSCAADSASVDGEEAEAAVVTEGIASTSIHVEDFEYPFENWDHDGKKVDHPVTIVFVSDRPEVVARVYEQVESVGLTHSGGKMTLSGIGGSRPGVNPTDVRVEEAMVQDVFTVGPTTPLGEAIETMIDRKVGSAIVCDGDRVLGVFTTIDALRALHALLERR